MKCEDFEKNICEFKHHPILFNKLIEQHKRENKDCTCKVDYIDL